MFNSPTEGFPWDDLNKNFCACQRMVRVPKRRRKIAEIYKRLSRVHERYRQMTDGRATAYSEREHEFTFAKNSNVSANNIATTSRGRKFT